MEEIWKKLFSNKNKKYNAKTEWTKHEKVRVDEAKEEK